MILPAAMTTLALMLTYKFFTPDDVNWERPLQKNAFVLICLLVMTAAVTKMNFLASGGIIGLTAFVYMVLRGHTWPAIFISLVTALLIFLPPMAWKQYYYGGDLISTLLAPFPGNWPGTDIFEASLRNYRDTNVPFPISLLVPSGPGTVSTVLGGGLFIAAMALVRVKNNPAKPFVIIAVIVASLGVVLGQQSSRFFM